ncbi:hypothetical protein M0P25_04310 [archaeon]|nr:hypothetical protein [archaeon]
MFEKQSELIYVKEHMHHCTFPTIPIESIDLILCIFDKLKNHYIDKHVPIIDYDFNNRVSGLLCEFDLKYKNRWVHNARVVQINSMIPSIMNHQFSGNHKHIEFNLTKFPTIYKKIFNARKEIKSDFKSTYTGELNLIVKILLNMMYSILHSKNSYLRCKSNYGLMLCHSTRRVMNEIQHNFPGNVMYIDIDMLFFVHFKDIEKRFSTFMTDKYPYLTYDVEIADLYVENKKKYTKRKLDGSMTHYGIQPIICD